MRRHVWRDLVRWEQDSRTRILEQMKKLIENIQVKSYDGKRDRWNGYNMANYSRVQELYELKEKAQEEKLKFNPTIDVRNTTPASGTSNPRVREDTAKYLLNLDVNSAYYDPKSRSMREDPNETFSSEEKNYQVVRKKQSQTQYANATSKTIIPKSRFAEDVFERNHTCVWGSWWIDHQWGYKCCKQTLRYCYCTASDAAQPISEASQESTNKVD